MTALAHGPSPGAVAVVSGPTGRDASQARAAVLAPFRGKLDSPQVFADGPLTLAWNATSQRALHVSLTTICLFEGTLYELDKLGRASGASGGPERLLAVAYERLGEDVLARLRGDFWALVWDRSRRRGILLTDQMASRSPYWAHEAGDLMFASEIPELLAALGRSPDPDPMALAHWLLLSAPPHGGTLFAGIRRLEAAHCLALGTGDGTPRRYWSPTYRAPLRAPRGELVERLQDTLSVSVRRRLADAPPSGVLLSGGLDSSVVAAMATRVRPGLHAYSATFPEHPTVDESHLIDCTVRHLKLPSTRIVVRGGSVLAGALAYMAAWRLPPTSPNLFFWSPLLARAALEGARVMLDGEGGDELFGFSPYLLADRLRHGRVLSALELAQRWSGSLRPPSAFLIQLRLRRFGLKGAMPPAAHLLMRHVSSLARYTPDWIRPSLARAWLESEDSAYAWKRLPGPRWWAFLVESVTRGVGPALVYEQSRRRAALAGLEARHPLVDVDVIELVLQLAPELAFDTRFSRPLLRETVAGLLPDEVRLRPAKSNFDALFHSALAGTDLPLARRLLGARDAELGAYVDLGAIRRELLAPEPPVDPALRQRWAIRVWRLLTAECWLRTLTDPSLLQDLGMREGLSVPDHELVRVG